MEKLPLLLSQERSHFAEQDFAHTGEMIPAPHGEFETAAPELTRLDAGLVIRRSEYNPRRLRGRFMVDEVALE
jgi:hypothetical protein